MIDSYRAALAGLLEGRRVDSVRSPTSVGSGWGTESRPFRERIGGVFVAPPGPRLLMSRARPVNVEYALASSLWILSGSDELAAIAKFNPRGAEFTADGFTLSGAFGWRLREAVGDQLAAIVDLLRLDPSSRRAVGFIGSPEDLFAQGRDFPCASLLHAFLRQGELVMTVYMRSQSFLGVFPYDLVNFHYVQDYLARNLEASLGELRFTFGSLHVYEHEVPLAEAFLDDGSAAFLVPPELNVLDARAELSDWLRDGSRRAADVCTSVRAAWSEEPATSVS